MKLWLTALSVIAALWLAVFYFVPTFAGERQIVAVIHWGGFTVHWYGLLMAVGILASFFAAQRLAQLKHLDISDLENLALVMVAAGLAGARAYFVIFSWGYFQEQLMEIFQIWHGGLSIYGGVISGLLAGWLYMRRKFLPAAIYLDVMAVSVPLAQAIGRFGNFFNQEAFGLPTSLPWKMFVDFEHRPPDYVRQRFFHPAFLYESIWDIFVFFLLSYIFLKQKPPAGFVLGSYFVFYGLGRFFIEGLRLDSFFVHGLRVDQIVSLVLILAGTGIMYFTYEPR